MRLAGHLERLMQTVIADPTAKLREADMLSKEERHELLNRFNENETDFPAPKPLPACLPTVRVVSRTGQPWSWARNS